MDRCFATPTSHDSVLSRTFFCTPCPTSLRLIYANSSSKTQVRHGSSRKPSLNAQGQTPLPCPSHGILCLPLQATCLITRRVSAYTSVLPPTLERELLENRCCQALICICSVSQAECGLELRGEGFFLLTPAKNKPSAAQLSEWRLHLCTPSGAWVSQGSQEARSPTLP